jgi:hypothetical protein
VSETDEEDSASSNELERYNNIRKRKIKVISLAHYSQLINKRIFSDDFDKESSD